MTSGNRTDEPIAIDDDDALARLAGIADLFVVHDRPIRTRCDDSVARVSDGAPLPIRRSRGYAPAPLALDPPLRVPTLAAGGELKATFALGAERRAFLSQHVGDLEHPAALRAYMDGIAHYERLFGIAPRRIVHDLHPDYAASHYALARSREAHLECLPVQHHHAHFASCLAEHGERGPAIGVAFDGTGYGLDGAIWGGEFLVGGAREVRRAAHLAYVALPGGDRATREPWRTAVAHLAAAGLDPLASAIAGRVPGAALGTVLRMIERRFQAPPTSSVGRLFDAAAAIAGVCDAVSFEGEAAMRLEALAAEAAADGGYPFEVREACPRPGPAAAGRREAGDGPMIVDPGPLVRALVRDLARGVAVPTAARRFHATLAEMIEEVCRRLRERTGLGTVCLSGGVFVNAILAEDAAARLARAGFRVLRHRLVPPNDGGLALGQLAVAAARDAASDG
jgi:hydrogenase maturation protein HypF